MCYYSLYERQVGRIKAENNIKKLVLRMCISFAASGSLYLGIETLFRIYRGHKPTHPLVLILGGAAYLICVGVHRLPLGKKLIWLKPLIGGVLLTAWEFAFGALFNIALGMKIWDYTGCPLQFMGQICFQFSLAWMGVTAGVMLIEYLLDNKLLKNTGYVYNRG